MKRIIAALTAALAFSTAADAGVVNFGFKSVDGVVDGAKEITWANGGITLSTTNNQLTVNIFGKDTLPAPLTAWVVDWAMPMGAWNKFDIYLNPPFNAACEILVTPIVDDWETMNQNMSWDQANTSDGGYCTTGENGAILTANLVPMPLPAGALLLLTGVAGFGLMRRLA